MGTLMVMRMTTTTRLVRSVDLADDAAGEGLSFSSNHGNICCPSIIVYVSVFFSVCSTFSVHSCFVLAHTTH